MPQVTLNDLTDMFLLMDLFETHYPGKQRVLESTRKIWQDARDYFSTNEGAVRTYFVFGSNEAGVHGSGAALWAKKYCGAKWLTGIGFSGSSYAIPTKDHQIDTLPLKDIEGYVRQFLSIAQEQINTSHFFVTRIGCGLAGYREQDIAPMFKDAPANCTLPYGWRNFGEDDQLD